MAHRRARPTARNRATRSRGSVHGIPALVKARATLPGSLLKAWPHPSLNQKQKQKQGSGIRDQGSVTDNRQQGRKEKSARKGNPLSARGLATAAAAQRFTTPATASGEIRTAPSIAISPKRSGV